MECGDSSPLDAKGGDESPHSTTSGLQPTRLRNISNLTSNFLLLKTLYRATINSLIFPNEITTYDEEIEAKLP